MDGSLLQLNIWIAAKRWITDAYMFALTYYEGSDPTKSSEVTIIHGGTLKQHGKLFHSSRTKQNVTGRINKGRFQAISTDVPYRH